jgi:hypothetical protein
LIDVQSNSVFDVSFVPNGFTLAAGQTLRGSGKVNQGGNTLTNNGTLSAGETNAMGTLTLNSGLQLGSSGTTSLRINKTGGVRTSDSIVGITTAVYAGALTVTNTGTGTLAVGDVFTLFGATSGSGNFSSIVGPAGYGFSFSAASGILSVVSTPPTSGTNLVFSVSGGKLNLSWPASYIGSALQSNSINILIPTNWYTITGSTLVTNESLPVGTNGSVFFRLNSP